MAESITCELPLVAHSSEIFARDPVGVSEAVPRGDDLVPALKRLASRLTMVLLIKLLLTNNKLNYAVRLSKNFLALPRIRCTSELSQIWTT